MYGERFTQMFVHRKDRDLFIFFLPGREKFILLENVLKLKMLAAEK